MKMIVSVGLRSRQMPREWRGISSESSHAIQPTTSIGVRSCAMMVASASRATAAIAASRSPLIAAMSIAAAALSSSVSCAYRRA